MIGALSRERAEGEKILLLRICCIVHSFSLFQGAKLFGMHFPGDKARDSLSSAPFSLFFFFSSMRRERESAQPPTAKQRTRREKARKKGRRKKERWIYGWHTES